MNTRTGFTAIALACIFTALPAIAFAFSPDSFLSRDIAEADGTSGQDTGIGSGVKTDHLQDGAVTTGKTADGSVTDAKIAGPISASKISSNDLDADTLDGKHAAELATAIHAHSQSEVTGLEAELAGKANILHYHDTLYQQKYGKVAVVAQTGGDFTDPVAAMNDLANWRGSPSATNPCLIKIMPAVYNIGSNSLTIRSFVDVEGSGQGVTKNTGNRREETIGYSTVGGLLRSWAGGLVRTEIRGLTIENTGSGSMYAVWINNWDSSSEFRFTNVAITASGASNYTSGIWFDAAGKLEISNAIITATNGFSVYGIYSSTAVLRANNTHIAVSNGTAENYGVHSYDTGYAISSTINASGGDALNLGEGSVFTSRKSEIVSGNIYGQYYGGTLAKANTASSMTSGFAGSLTLKYVDTYDSNYDIVSCP